MAITNFIASLVECLIKKNTIVKKTFHNKALS